VRNGEDFQLRLSQPVNDAVRESTQWQAADGAAPRGTQGGVGAEDFYGALEFGDEGAAKVGAGFAPVVESGVG